MGDISLSKAVRSNLLSLQNTSAMMNKTQDRLATGNKVNSALDNPTNFFTAASLNSRAGDLNLLMDSMANGIQTLEAADNGLTAITKNLESMQSTLRQARQDKSFQTASYNLDPTKIDTASQKTISFKGGAVGSTAVSLNLVNNPGVTGSAATAATSGDMNFATAMTFDNPGDKLNFTLNVSGTATNISIDANTLADAGLSGGTIDDAADMRAALKQALVDKGVSNVEVGGTGAAYSLTTVDKGVESTIQITAVGVVNGGGTDTLTNTSGLTNMATADAGTAAVPGASVKSTDTLVSEINNNDSLEGKIRASNDNGKLRIENLSTEDLVVDGVSSGGSIDATSTGAAKILGNSVRADLASQYNELRDQLDKLADDASFNGINLLRGDKLTITFNETGTSSIDIQTKGEEAVNSGNLKISTSLDKSDLDSDTNIDAELAKLKTALSNVRSQSSAFGSNLSVVQNRQDFTKATINTLQTGAANLTLADMNEEAANLLALQTRQSLSSNSLSLASQADQSILQLIR